VQSLLLQLILGSPNDGADVPVCVCARVCVRVCELPAPCRYVVPLVAPVPVDWTELVDTYPYGVFHITCERLGLLAIASTCQLTGGLEGSAA
jgi:hypothetical protein